MKTISPMVQIDEMRCLEEELQCHLCSLLSVSTASLLSAIL